MDVNEFLEKFKCSNFYIDKTLLIKEFLECSRIVCVTDPFLYGKTLNLNMMR